MTKQKLFFFSTILVIGYVFLTVVFENIPIGGLWFISLILYTGSLLILKPEIFISRQMLVVYTFILIYYFLVPLGSNPVEKSWFLRRVIPLYISISLSEYYLKSGLKDSYLRLIVWFTIGIVLISSLTTLLGLERYPNASRELASNVGGDMVMASLYKKLGIMGYGFITSLGYLIPLIVLLFQHSTKKIKFVWLGYILLLSYTVLKAQYATQFLLFVVAMILSIMGTSYFTRHRLAIAVIVVLVLIIPKGIYVGGLELFAEALDEGMLKVNLLDLATTLSDENIVSADTHVSDRYSRIPFLVEEFLRSPIYGGGKSTGHVFWLDHLSLYGLLGIIPWFLFMNHHYRYVRRLLKKTFFYYQIAFFIFIALGFMKGSGNREQYIMLFCILPFGLYLVENNLLLKQRK